MGDQHEWPQVDGWMGQDGWKGALKVEVGGSPAKIISTV